ncbi:MAG: hypothetical protein R2839_10375 [Thermomicrobiales bacterium]
MPTTDTTEKGLESLIVASLTGATVAKGPGEHGGSPLPNGGVCGRRSIRQAAYAGG